MDDPKPSTPKLHLVLIIAIPTLVLVGIIIAIVMLVPSQPSQTVNGISSTANSTNQPVNTTPTSEQAKMPIPEDQIQWVKSEQTQPTYTTPDNFPEQVSSNDTPFKVATFTGGELTGYDLILLKSETFQKGGGYSTTFYRYAKRDSEAIILTSISDTLYGSQEPNQPPPAITSANYRQYLKDIAVDFPGLDIRVDDRITITSLEIGTPPDLVVEGSNMKLVGPSESLGQLDGRELVRLGMAYGKDVYSDSSPKNAPKSFYRDEDDAPAVQQGYYFFRKDGTFLTYTPEDILPEQIRWADGTRLSTTDIQGYSTSVRLGCNDTALLTSVIPSNAVQGGKDLVPIGTLDGQETIYGLQESQHSILKEFYQSYSDESLREYGTPYQLNAIGDDAQPLTYEQFLAQKPLFFRYDPFGRIIRYENTSFQPGLGCEPIIYLYPDRPMEVGVRVKPGIGLTRTDPPYNVSWRVLAEPSGRLIDLRTGIRYPYLFWEGWLPIVRSADRGFVVENPHVQQFFEQMLPRLGLNATEVNDFLKAWLPRFHSSPYYFITFLDRELIDALAPLEVRPHPDTVIRVLMTFRPLLSPIAVEPLELPDLPKRKGFTVVEWGGILP